MNLWLVSTQALDTRDPGIVWKCLEHGANPNYELISEVHSMRTDRCSKQTPLHTAVQSNSLELAEVLLENGALVDELATTKMQNERGFREDREETALHMAVAERNLEMCRLLLETGTDPNAVRKCLDNVHLPDIQSPTNDPRDENFVSRVKIIPESATALHLALNQNLSEIANLMIAHGADTSIEYRHGDRTFSCQELCRWDTQLLAGLNLEWTPESHKHYPKQVRFQIFTVLLIATREKWILTKDVLFFIFKKLAKRNP